MTMRNAHCKDVVHTDLYSTHRDQWLCSMDHRVGWGEMGIAGKMGHVGYANEWPILPAMPISPPYVNTKLLLSTTKLRTTKFHLYYFVVTWSIQMVKPWFHHFFFFGGEYQSAITPKRIIK